MHADIHDGPEHTLQSEAGYIDARPQTDSSTKTSCDARPDHTLGHFEPPRLGAVAAELASIADAGKAWRGPRRSATSPRRQVLPNDRTPRLTGAAPAPGHLRRACLWLASCVPGPQVSESA